VVRGVGNRDLGGSICCSPTIFTFSKRRAGDEHIRKSTFKTPMWTPQVDFLDTLTRANTTALEEFLDEVSVHHKTGKSFRTWRFYAKN